MDIPDLPIKGCATPVETFRRAFGAEGVPATSLSAEQLADPAMFNNARFDLLVVPTGASFPATAVPTLRAFLAHGGDLLCTGGYAFDSPVVRAGSDWITCADRLAAEKRRGSDPSISLVPNGDFAQGEAGWRLSSSSACAIEADPQAGDRRCARVTGGPDELGGSCETTLAVEPGGSYVIGGCSRTSNVTGAGYAFFSVYQYGRNGDLLTFRDFAVLTRTHSRRRYETRLTVEPLADRVVFRAGLYRAAGTLRFDQVTCARVSNDARINAHYDQPSDLLNVGAEQLTLFSPDQPLAGTSLRLAAAGPLAGNWHSEGAVRGFEATAQMQTNGRWLPLVEARDRFGRFSGAAGALVTHFAGPYVGSNWALFGVTNRDIFAGSDGETLLRRVVRLMTSRVHAEQLTTNYALYHPGETATIQLTLAWRGPAAGEPRRRIVTVRGELRDPDSPSGSPPIVSETAPVTLAPGAPTEVTTKWRVPAGAPPFVVVRTVVLSDSGSILDRIETGFCVASARAIRSGPAIRFRDNGFDLRYPGGRALRTTLFGTDTGNMLLFGAADPVAWRRDMRMMRDYGLHMFENLQYQTPNYKFDEAQWRQFDAMVQLSQQQGLAYMAGLLIGQNVAIDDATLEQQAAFCRTFAARYKSTPGLIYYLNGDFQLAFKDSPTMRQYWNKFLGGRYKTDAALRAAWGAAAPEEPLGQIPANDVTPTRWYDIRARDTAEFKVFLVRRWIGALSRAVRSEDRAHPITAEFYQAPYSGVDLRLESGLLDAANFGYFAPPEQDFTHLASTIRWNDMRLAGRSVNIGEFGVKTHDAWTPENGGTDYHIARTESEQRRYFWTVVHAALAWHVTKIQNWCWSDDPNNIFPWGIAWNNPLRPKPVLKMMRNLRLLSDRAPQGAAAAPVVVVLNDRCRLGAPDGYTRSGLFNALECLLATNTPFDVTNLADMARLKPRRPKLILVPLAYALSDAEVETLRALASAGSSVYLSGDPGIGTDGRRVKGRLERLCGVRVVRAQESGFELPTPDIAPARAARLRSTGRTALYRLGVGRGFVYYAPAPWEMLPGEDLFGKDPEVAVRPERNLYLPLLKLVGVSQAVIVRGQSGIWRAVRTVGHGNDLVTLFPRQTDRTVTRVSVQTGTAAIGFESASGWPCALLRDTNGRPLAATGGRRLSIAGREVARGESPWMLVALDGRPLASSSALAGCLTEGGRLRWRSDAKQMSGWLVEWRTGRATVVQSVPARRASEGWEIEGPPNELILIAPRSGLQAGLRSLSAELGR